MVGVGRDLCGSSSPTLLPRQGHLQQPAEDLVQDGLEYLQRRRLHNLPGQPGPGLHHPQREEVLPHVQLELPLLQFVPVAPCPTSPHAVKATSTHTYSRNTLLAHGRGRRAVLGQQRQPLMLFLKPRTDAALGCPQGRPAPVGAA